MSKGTNSAACQVLHEERRVARSMSSQEMLNQCPYIYFFLYLQIPRLHKKMVGFRDRFCVNKKDTVLRSMAQKMFMAIG